MFFFFFCIVFCIGLGFGLLGLGLSFALFRLQLVGWFERRTQPFLQGDCVDFVGPVEMRIRLSRPPGTENRGPQGTVRQEIDPFTIGAPRCPMIVVAVRGDRRHLGFFDVVEHHLIERVRRFEIE